MKKNEREKNEHFVNGFQHFGQQLHSNENIEGKKNLERNVRHRIDDNYPSLSTHVLHNVCRIII